jgi:hypothetical protein
MGGGNLDENAKMIQPLFRGDHPVKLSQVVLVVSFSPYFVPQAKSEELLSLLGVSDFGSVWEESRFLRVSKTPRSGSNRSAG